MVMRFMVLAEVDIARGGGHLQQNSERVGEKAESGKAEPARRSLAPPGVAEWGGRKAEGFRRVAKIDGRGAVPPRETLN